MNRGQHMIKIHHQKSTILLKVDKELRLRIPSQAIIIIYKYLFV